jgi:LacI family transcriptional regulator
MRVFAAKTGTFFRMKSPTQEEIAQKLGLSRATVSRVLRNVSGPKSSTAARIIEVAQEMGYRLPATENTASRKGVGRQKTAVLGLLLCMPDVRTTENAEVPMRALHGATDASREQNVLLHVEYISVSDAAGIQSVRDLPKPFRQKQVSGAVLFGRLTPVAVSAFLEKVPCVRIADHDPGVLLDLVGQDDRTAVRELVLRLKALGHRKIGYYCLQSSASYALARFSGYVEALALAGLEYSPAWSVNIWERSGGSGFDQVQRAVDDGVTAWICAHDEAGYELIRFFNSRGLQVPQDCSVCGFDNLPVPEGMPAMATIDWPFEDIVASAVGVLLQRVNEPMRAFSQLQFGGRMIAGETVGPCPAA